LGTTSGPFLSSAEKRFRVKPSLNKWNKGSVLRVSYGAILIKVELKLFYIAISIKIEGEGGCQQKSITLTLKIGETSKGTSENDEHKKNDIWKDSCEICDLK
jgi:hypothetical protein